MRPLGDVAFVQQGRSPGKKDLGSAGTYPVVKVKDFVHRGGVSFAGGAASFTDAELGDRYTLEPGDSLVLAAAHSSSIVGSKIGWVDALPPGPKVFHTAEVIKLRPVAEVVDPFYLFVVLLWSPTGQSIKSIVKGGHLYASALREISVPVPPIAEQRAIAHALRRVQLAREQTDSVLDASKQLARSLLAHVFSYGPLPLAQTQALPLKDSSLGPLPEHWEVTSVDEVFESRLGKMLSPAAKVGNEPKPYLRNVNVQWRRVRVDDLATMDFSVPEQEKFRLRAGDAVVCEGGEVGRTAVWRNELSECYFQKAIHRVRTRDERSTTSFFMYHMLHAFTIAKTYGVPGTETTIAHLPGVKLKSLPIPLPPREEQDEIVNVLEAVDAKIAAELSRRDALDELFISLLNELMTGNLRRVPSGV